MKLLFVMLLCLMLVGCGSKEEQELTTTEIPTTTTVVTTEVNTTTEVVTTQLEEPPTEDVEHTSTAVEVATWLDGTPRGYSEFAKAIQDNPDVMMHVCMYLLDGAPYDMFINPADRFALFKDYCSEGWFYNTLDDMTRWFEISQELRPNKDSYEIEDNMYIEKDNEYYTYNEYVELFGIPDRSVLPHGLYPDEYRAGMVYDIPCEYKFYYADYEDILFVQLFCDGMHMYDIEFKTDGLSDLFYKMTASVYYE